MVLGVSLVLSLILTGPKRTEHLRDVAVEHHLCPTEVAPCPPVSHIKLYSVLWPGQVMLGGVVIPGLCTAQHVAVGVQAHPEVGGAAPPHANVAGHVSQELPQVGGGQTAHTAGHMETGAGGHLVSTKWMDLQDKM